MRTWRLLARRGTERPKSQNPVWCSVRGQGGHGTLWAGPGPGVALAVWQGPHMRKKTWPREARRGTGGELASPREHPALSQTRQGHSKGMQEASGIPGVGYDTGSRRPGGPPSRPQALASPSTWAQPPTRVTATQFTDHHRPKPRAAAARVPAGRIKEASAGEGEEPLPCRGPLS